MGNEAVQRCKDLNYVEVSSDDLDLLVGFSYEPGSPGRHTLANGDPGYPPVDDVIEIGEVWAVGVDISATLSQRQREEIEASVWDKWAQILEDRRESDLAASDDARRDWS